MTQVIVQIRQLLTSSERKSVVVLLALGLAGVALETLGIGLIIPAVALLTQENIATRYPAVAPLLDWLGNPGERTLIVGAMLTLLGVYAIKALFLAFLAWWQTRFVYSVQLRLSQRLFEFYLTQPYTFHLQHNSAQLIANVASEASLFKGVLREAKILITEGLVLVGIASLLVVVEPLGALIVALVLGVASWSFYRSTRARVTHWGLTRQSHDVLRIQHLQQGLGGVKDVILLGREVEFLAQYQYHHVRAVQAGQFHDTLLLLPRLWLELLTVTGMVLLVLTMLAQGRNLSAVVPTMALFAIAAFRLMPSVNRVLSALQSIRYGLPVITNLHKELHLATPERSEWQKAHQQKAHAIVTIQADFRLAGISYTYPAASAPALTDLTIVARKGECVGLIGPSGSGKTTVVDVILGLLTPNAGEVLVNGQNIQNNLRSWQDQIGYVPQSIFLTDDTIRRNVAFGLPEKQIDDTAVWRAIKSAQLEEFVSGLPSGMETIVGERGVRLSGGQRQRIGIARALYHDPSLLVLDEATSSLDSATERNVLEAVVALHGTKTIFVVAHRLSTLAQCDRLYRLELGRVIDEGTPQSMNMKESLTGDPDAPLAFQDE